MKRTTLALDEGLLRLLKTRAAKEDKTLQDLANDLLRKALADPPHGKYRLKLIDWKAQEQPGVDLFDRDKLFDLMEGR